MTASELQKKAVYFVTFVVLTLLVLSALPFVESWLQASVFPQFGMDFVKGWQLSEASAQVAMNVTYATAIETAFRVLKIVLWMATVIAFVRFFAYVILRTANRNSTETNTSSLLKTVLSITIYIIAFFLIFQVQFPGVPLTGIFTGSTILGIVVGLALQDTLGNLFAGLALQADQPFVVGDVIMIPGRGEGVVETVSWRGVKIRTFQNKLLVISNAVLGKETIEVAPKGNLNAKAVFFNSMYSKSPAFTIQVVRDAVRQVENVSPKIRPVVRIRNLGDNGIDWEVKYWLEDYTKQHDTDALIRQRIWYVFQREKIEFAYPTRTIHVEPKPVEIAPAEIVDTISEHLNQVTIFAPLSEDEIDRLANASTSRVYAPGEAIVRIGQEGGSMYVIIRGSVKVQIPEKSYQKTINTLGTNDFFGEMSLLTGEPRSANVIAEVESEVLRIDKNGLKPIFESNPVLVQSIVELVEERRILLTTVAQAEEEEHDETKKGVMKSLKKFFGLR